MSELEAELNRLNMALIEKESDLHSKVVHCHVLETKMKKAENECKQLAEEFNCRLNGVQQDNLRLEAEIMDVKEKYRRNQVSTHLSFYVTVYNQ